jgi:hypothetical protein
MKKLLATVALVSSFATSAYAQEPKEIFGSWKVVSIETITAGKSDKPMGDKPMGFLTITPTRVNIMFTESDRKVESARLSDAEALKMFKSSVAWTGHIVSATASPKGVMLIVHVDAANNQGLVDKDRNYVVTLTGDKMMWTSPGIIDPQTGMNSSLEVALVKSE